MPFESHDRISEPENETVIWRYYDTSQFLSVLQNGALHLSRLDQLDDPWEGYSPVRNIEKELEAKEKWAEEFDGLVDNTCMGSPEERIERGYEFIRRSSLVNCWSKGVEDLLEMWNAYLQTGDGIAVRLTFGNLKQAIHNESELSYHAGEVEYYDYLDDFIKTVNQFDFIMSKPHQYEYEREIRLFVWWPTSGEIEEGTEEPKPGDMIEKETLMAPSGTKIDVDLDTLIQSIYVSPFGPPWASVEYWNDILEKYEVKATAEMSGLAMEPATVLDQE